MKNFFGSFLATLTALVVFFCGGSFIAVLLLIAMAAAGEKPVAVQAGSFLVVDLSATLQDTPSQMEGWDEIAEAFGGGAGQQMQLRQLTRAIDAAATDPDIAGLYLRGNPVPLNYGSGYAALKEVREALLRFKKSGKPIKAYIRYAGTRGYYLASVADEITLDPYGAIQMPGLASQPMFFTGAFEKFGIGVQVTRVGKYKSAVEPFTQRQMSPENRQQTQKLLDDVWGELVTDIEQARKLEPGSLQRAIDAEGLLRPEAAKTLRLVDRIAYYDTVLNDLRQATGRMGANEAFKQIPVKNYAKLVAGDGLAAKRRAEGKVELGGKGRIAIVYAEGEIVDGSGEEQGYVYGEKVARELRRLRQDAGVKAVVLRVNSPGGSATASEAIQRELRLTRGIKPVVVSMGSLAASGGYWISTYSDRIFAEPSTITGSIGVFGMFLNLQGLSQDKLGLTFDTVKTGKFADMMTITRPKTAEELAVFQGYVDWIYDEFVGKVAESRKLQPGAVREIAQGRVWSGREALKLGLVDELGGLDQAVAFAAEKAGLGDNFRVSEFPRRKQFAEAFAEAFEKHRRDQTLAGPVGALVAEAQAQFEVLAACNDPQGVYARLPFDLSLR